ncbi:MAG: 16S rRNA processing protein RimM [Nitrospirae bacterium]|nr:MAG: 16S rRNA processing protein RimM [Nitrospirota bacterium]
MMETDVGSRELITIGKILRPFGVRGEVRVYPLSDVPGRYDSLTEVILDTDGHRVPTTVTGIRKAGEHYLVRFSAFSTPEEAAAFRGAWLQIPIESAVPPPPGHYYHYQLIGMTVQTERGDDVGQLAEIYESPHHHVFLIRKGSEERLIPAVRDLIIHVDVDRQIMTVRVPEE